MDGRQLAVEGPGQADAVEGDGRQVNVDHLAPGVHPGVGAPGTGERRAARHPSGAAQGVAQGPATVGTSGWRAKPRKAAPS